MTVDVDEEDLEVMSLEEVEASRATLAHDGGDGRLLCTYDGIVYDVTSFADAHPGWKGTTNSVGHGPETFFRELHRARSFR